ncbi:hypothetical protein MCU_00042 [Bartonella elizabethae Re6043vi]|uniref:Uncharacterized protein n=2 Tax=Bartonella elizabethae TaxID=807 RepID=J1KBY3_BAREL|nr:hypothetical protein MCU_00042 [Bartonella elizabethae Re6043vi]EJF95337.1 hypothetical protein MEE_01172 [Bartonella elizabethae F9251 = ATCC 49927]VEJ41651.1 Uncharacterised protein [Bartonella elizabethae]
MESYNGEALFMVTDSLYLEYRLIYERINL